MTITTKHHVLWWRNPRALVPGAMLAIILMALLGGLFFCEGNKNGDKPATPDDRTTVGLSTISRAKNPITTTSVERVRLGADLDLVGSVAYDSDHYAVVGPLVDGRVAAIKVHLGDHVYSGQVLAEIELAAAGQAEGAYLSSLARNTMSQANLKRERILAEQHVSSGRDKEIAEAQAVADASDLRANEQRLLALGLTQGDLVEIRDGKRRAGLIVLRSPIAGTVVKRLISLGQAIQSSTDAFYIADLRHLWVQLDLYEKDLAHVHIGQKVDLKTEAWPGEVFPSRVAYIEPRIDEDTRTSSVRIEIDNREGKLRPGQFITAHITAEPGSQTREVLAVPRRAIVTSEGRSLAFVETKDGQYTKRVVELGRTAGDKVEIRTGLTEGEKVVAEGSFLLKSELQR